LFNKPSTSTHPLLGSGDAPCLEKVAAAVFMDKITDMSDCLGMLQNEEYSWGTTQVKLTLFFHRPDVS
jgi:hypothetical protein